MRRFFAIAWKEFIQLRRDRLTMGMMIGLPVMQLLLFGFAINVDVRNMATVVYDQDHSAASRDFVRSMEATGYYRVLGAVRSYDEIAHALRSGEARVAVVLAHGFGESVELGSGARVQLVVDGSDPQTVASATNTVAALAAVRSAEIQVSRLRAAGRSAQLAPIHVETTTWYNPEVRTAVYIVPGLIGVILLMTMIMLTSMAIARERERGTLEQLIVSPIRRIELIAGKIAPYILIGYVQMSLVLLVGRVVFRVPLQGSLALLYLLAILYIASNLALGLLFSTIAKTQQQAMQMSFFFMLPNILLSGFMFPFEGMPRPAQWLSQCFPLTHFLRIVRGITLRGGHFADVAVEVQWLAFILVALVTITSLRFSKKLG